VALCLYPTPLKLRGFVNPFGDVLGINLTSSAANVLKIGKFKEFYEEETERTEVLLDELHTDTMTLCRRPDPVYGSAHESMNRFRFMSSHRLYLSSTQTKLNLCAAEFT